MVTVNTRKGQVEACALGYVAEATVEDLNPRSRPVKSLEMAVKRGWALDKIMSTWLAFNRDDLDATKRLNPIPYFTVEDGSIIRMVNDWPWAVGHWYSGGLRRSIEATLDNLPSTVRDRLEKERE